MKKTILFTTIIFFSIISYSQDIIDPYDIEDGTTFNGVYIHDFTGEYQIGLTGLYWFNEDFNPPQSSEYIVSFSFECVSFPFIPDCLDFNSQNYSCYGGTSRVFVLPESDMGLEYGDLSSGGTGWYSEDISNRELINTSIPVAIIYTDKISTPASLSSYAYVNHDFEWANRMILPHTVLRMNLNVHDGPSVEDDPIILKLSWIYDNTRGRMNYYPFKNTNQSSGYVKVYDVIFFPHYKYHGYPYFLNTLHEYYTPVTNVDWFTAGAQPPSFTSEPQGSINYYHADDYDQVPPYYPFGGGPFPPGGNGFFGYYPAQYTLFSPTLLNASMKAYAGYDNQGQYGANSATMQVGIEHDYIINEPFDLNLINNDEKIIYNPSKVEIDCDFIFPLNYKFLTVHGKYPDKSWVEFNNTTTPPYDDLRDVLCPSDQIDENGEFLTEYIVNYTLTIEPGVTIMDAQINGTGTVRYYPDDIRGNFKLSTDLKLEFLSDQIIIDDPFVTWENEIKFLGSLISIEPGATLEIKNTLEVGNNTKIIVKRGGKLIIDGGTITSQNGIWQGILVHGTSNQPQNNTYQGKVKVINGGTIENALCGIRAVKMSDDIPNYDYTGGIVKANNAVFKNNTVAVQFYDYATHSKSSFRDCDFIVDDGYPGDENPGYAVKMSGMKGIVFTACDFTNNSSENCFGSGIYSLDSWLKVQGKCADPQQQNCEEENWIMGTFTNLEHGVYATSGGSINFPIISHIDFDNNHRGVYFSGTESGTVEFCDFTTGPNCANNGSSYGVYLDRSTGYTIEENDFIQGPADAIGLVVNNSGGDPNIIYRNTFTGLLFGTLPQQVNRSISFIDQGLQYKCNQFYGNGHDIVVVESSPSQSGDGIKQNQGANLAQPDGPAGNIFTNLGPEGTATDIFNNASDVVYYFHDYEFENLEPLYYSGETVNPEENNYPGAYWDPEESCPPSDNGGGIGDTDGLKGLMATSGNKADSVQNIITILKDGGSTEDMKLEVDLSTPPETYSIYTELMGSSPYISDTVMGAAIEKEDVLPNVMIRDVMVANPHNAKNDELMDIIEERSDPMPDYMKAQIIEGGGLVSLFENLQSQRSYYKQKRANAFNALVRQYVSDTIDPSGSTDSLRALLQNENTLEAKYRLAFLSLGQGAWSLGQDILDNIPQQFSLTAGEQDNHAQVIAYSEILANLAQQGKTIMEADSSQVEALFDIESSGIGITSVYARNVLLAMGEIEYDEPILMPDFTKSSAISEERAKLMKALDEHRYLEVFPNPACDYLIIGHELELLQENPYAEILNLKGEKLKHIKLNGKQNQETLNIKELKPGVYIVTLYANNKELESVKFTKTK